MTLQDYVCQKGREGGAWIGGKCTESVFFFGKYLSMKQFKFALSISDKIFACYNLIDIIYKKNRRVILDLKLKPYLSV